ncbi:MAG TPA: glucan biosynthesis protein [Planctomicrobium sp.]|nr:glucan biosynthesis protein [Planctomicrobium sp.]
MVTAIALPASNVIASELVPERISSYQQLQEAACTLSKRAYTPQPELPPDLKNINYDLFRQIGFIDGKELWKEDPSPFRVGFYHKGYVAVDDVKINLIEGGNVVPVPFSKTYFHYLGTAAKWKIPDDLGFAGFRAQGRFPGEEQFSEIFSFVGASYFRARASNTILGTSARGLAINCGLPEPEEFPVFREYWIEKPATGDTSLCAYALMDSPSVVGAYELTMTPAIEKTEIDVRQTLYFRQVPKKVGIAPLSSMWLWGDALPGAKGDHRPEVHDSDGLQVQTSDGKWFWRALGQQHYPSLVHLKQNRIRGFGLIQRDTNPVHYLDDEALYHQRPSVWIEPRSEWGPGAIELLELPAPHEGIDNIAAWWVPEKPVEIGTPVNFNYRLSFFLGDRSEHHASKAVAHRVTRPDAETILVEIDFNGPNLAQVHPDAPPVPQVVSIRGAVPKIECHQKESGLWTARLEVKPTGEGPVELTVTLKSGEQELTETWAYLCPLTPPGVSLPPWKIKADEKESIQ